MNPNFGALAIATARMLRSCHTLGVDWLAKSALVFAGAGVGGVCRFWLGLWVQSRASQAFPWGTFLINVSGSFAIGIALGLLLRLELSPTWRLLLVVGFLGGYTTFSTFSHETLDLIREGAWSYALLNAVGSVILGVAGAWIGDWLAARATGSLA